MRSPKKVAHYECRPTDKFDSHMMLTMDQACPDDLTSMMSTMEFLAKQVFDEKVLYALNVPTIRFKSLRNVKLIQKKIAKDYF